jgi:hypothetical protein
MQDAIELGEFFRAHIIRFLTLLQATAPTQLAGLSARIVRILRMVIHETDDGWATRSDLLHRLGNVKTDELTVALDELLGARTVERRSIATATKPVEVWRLATGLDSTDDSKYSHFSNYSVSEPAAATNGSGNFELFEYFASPNGHDAKTDSLQGEEGIL